VSSRTLLRPGGVGPLLSRVAREPPDVVLASTPAGPWRAAIFRYRLAGTPPGDREGCAGLAVSSPGPEDERSGLFDAMTAVPAATPGLHSHQRDCRKDWRTSAANNSVPPWPRSGRRYLGAARRMQPVVRGGRRPRYEMVENKANCAGVESLEFGVRLDSMHLLAVRCPNPGSRCLGCLMTLLPASGAPAEKQEIPSITCRGSRLPGLMTMHASWGSIIVIRLRGSRR
jgi:hypothetical protein